jgi:tyrosyl-tRNA synthetase
MSASVDEQLRALGAGAVDVISDDELRAKLERGRPLRAKLGIDPTASDIHLGFAVVLRKLRQFQELGHTAVLILGDFTAQVGDPSGRSATRPRLTKEEVDAHAETYLEQIYKILSRDRLEVRRNSEWLGTMGIEDVLRLASRTTVAQMLQRDDFARRYDAGNPISVMELLYPLLQGWDSVMVQADVELGGTDQLFNFHVARDLQQQEGQEPQVILTMPLLVGLDGTQKMSKSLGNYVGIDETPAEQFGKVMSIPDEQIEAWATVTVPPAVQSVVSDRLREAKMSEAKRALARGIVEEYHQGEGEAAESEFDRVVKRREPAADTPEHVLSEPATLSTIMRDSGIAPSGREARRLIEQGSVRLEGEKVGTDREFTPEELAGKVLQAGRRPPRSVRFTRG